jgi:hypothetical protein
MNLECLNEPSLLPDVPNLVNDSTAILIHESYAPASAGLTQIISSSLARRTLSNENIHALVERFTDTHSPSWTASTISKMEPVSSMIIYVSITLGLCVLFSLVFCVLSCVNNRKRNTKQVGN